METKMKQCLLNMLGKHPHQDLREALFALGASVDSAARTNLSQDEKINALTQENAELRLYLVSIICLLLKKKLIVSDELSHIVKSVDEADGQVDGRYKGKIL